MIRVLGDVSVDSSHTEGGGRGPGQTYKRLIAVLAAEANTSVSAESLIEALWFDTTPPKTARASFRNFCTRLRRELEPLDAELVVESQSGLGSRYMLKVNDEELDQLAFQRALERSERLQQSGSLSEAALLIEQALDLWQGPAFNDIDLDRVQPLRQQLEDLRISAHERLAAVYYRMGRYDACIHLLTALNRAHPERERLAAILMRSLYRTGRARDALNVFQETRQALAESGLTVATELSELERAILTHERSLADPKGVARRDADRRGPFVGRGEIVNEIISAVQTTTSFFCVSAGPGMGKSRLLSEIRAAALDHRIAVLAARPSNDYPTPLDTFDQLFEQIASIAEDMTDLRDRYASLRSGLRSAFGARNRHERLRDLVRRLDGLRLVGFDAVLLTIDDAHSIDELSLFALHEWARLDKRFTSFLAMARPAPSGTAWARFMSEVTSIPESTTRTLRPLSDSDVAEWLRSLDDRPSVAPESLAPTLCEHARGNPYLIGHLIRDLLTKRGSDDVLKLLREAWVPDDLTHVVRARLERLSAAQRRFLAAAAVVGRRFRVGDVASIARGTLEFASPPDLRSASDLLLGPDESGFLSFDHDLTRVAAMDFLDDRELKTLHRSVFQTLERNGRPTWELAHHAYAAVPLIETNVALDVTSSAAQELFDQSSFSAAAGFYEAAIDLVPVGDLHSRDRLRIQRARSAQQLGLRDEAILEFEQVIDRCIAGDPDLAAEAALAAAEFADVIDVDDPVASMLERASSGQVVDPILRSRLALELSINRAIKGIGAEPSLDEVAIDSDHDVELGVAWLHQVSGSPNPVERLNVTHRLTSFEASHHPSDLQTEVALFEFAALSELGATDEAHAALDSLTGLDPTPTQRWTRTVIAAGESQNKGYLAEAAATAMQAFELGNEIGHPDTGPTLAGHMLISGLLTNNLDTSDWGISGEPSVDEPLIVVAADAAVFAACNDDRAHRFLSAAMSTLLDAPTSTLTPGILALLSETTLRLNDAEAAKELLPRLHRYTGFLLRMGLIGGCLGPSDYYIGRLEELLGQAQRAQNAFQRGARLAHSAQLPVWEGLCVLGLGRVDRWSIDPEEANALAALLEDRCEALHDLVERLRDSTPARLAGQA